MSPQIFFLRGAQAGIVFDGLDAAIAEHTVAMLVDILLFFRVTHGGRGGIGAGITAGIATAVTAGSGGGLRLALFGFFGSFFGLAYAT